MADAIAQVAQESGRDPLVFSIDATVSLSLALPVSSQPTGTLAIPIPLGTAPWPELESK